MLCVGWIQGVYQVEMETLIQTGLDTIRILLQLVKNLTNQFDRIDTLFLGESLEPQ